MRYNKIRKMDISNGPGVRVSIFEQGCAFNCKNCFNQETHDFAGGKEFTDETLERLLNLCKNENVEGLSILGGEPMHPKNIDGTLKIAKAFKEKFPKKNIWVWTGFLFDKDIKNKEVAKYIDVLVDGQYNIKVEKIIKPKSNRCEKKPKKRWNNTLLWLENQKTQRNLSLFYFEYAR